MIIMNRVISLLWFGIIDVSFSCFEVVGKSEVSTSFTWLYINLFFIKRHKYFCGIVCPPSVSVERFFADYAFV